MTLKNKIEALFKGGLILGNVQVRPDTGQLNIHQGHVVLFQGRLGSLKECLVLVEQKLGLAWQMHGDSAQADGIAEMAKKYGLCYNIEFLPWAGMRNLQESITVVRAETRARLADAWG